MADDIEAALRAAADEWERLRSSATPGPWEECKSSPYESSVHHIEVDVCIASARMAENAEGTVALRPRDAAFIAHAANADVAGLLRRAAGEVATLRAQIAELVDGKAACYCTHCKQRWPAGKDGLAAYREHWNVCPKSPLVAERDYLWEVVARLRNALRGPHVPDESSEI